MITTTQAQELLEQRGISAPYQTVVRWARSGAFAGAQLDESNPRGAVWLIPVASVETFTPPARGWPKGKARKVASAKTPAKRARKRAA
jgi:hypothetical protein